MIVAIRVQPSQHGNEDEYVRLAEIATLNEVFAELSDTARHYTKVRDRYHRATAWSSSGRVLATVGVSPRALACDRRGAVGRPPARCRTSRLASAEIARLASAEADGGPHK